MTPPSQEIVLDGPGISRALKRMAHGIVARFPGEPLAIVGLLSQGDVIARRLVDKVKELGSGARMALLIFPCTGMTFSSWKPGLPSVPPICRFPRMT